MQNNTSESKALCVPAEMTLYLTTGTLPPFLDVLNGYCPPTPRFVQKEKLRCKRTELTKQRSGVLQVGPLSDHWWGPWSSIAET